MLKLTLAAALILVTGGGVTAQPPMPPPPPDAPASGPEKAGAVVLPPGLTQEGVKAAIVRALTHREWQLISAEGPSIRAHLLHRKKDCTLVFQFDAARIDIFSDSYVVDRAGVRVGRIIPNDWIENLQTDIREYVGHLPPR